MENYRCHKSFIPKTRVERISDTVEFPSKTFHMPQMSSMIANYHDAQDIIYALQNTAPARHLVNLGHGQKEALKILANIFRKANPSVVPLRVPVREVGKVKLQ